MAIFHSTSRIQFGSPVPAPNDLRPTEANFVQGKVPPGGTFALTWAFDRSVVGYHVFRSQSVRHIRDRSMHHLWQGHYRESITHFVIGDSDIDTVIDDYKLRGATFMFYWVLSQDSYGNLAEIKDLQVRPTDDFAKARRHRVLDYEPQVIHELPPTTPLPPPQANVSPTAPQQQPTHRPTSGVSDGTQKGGQLGPGVNIQPLSQPSHAVVQPAARAPSRELRQVYFVTYQAPGTFEITKDQLPIDHYQVYVGPEIPPSADLADAMWDGNLLPGNPMRCYTLPGNVEGFVDKYSAPGQTVYLAVFALRQDGTRTQPTVMIPPAPPAMVAELT